MSSFSSLRFLSSPRLALLGLLLVGTLALPTAARAQEERPQLDDRTHDVLEQKLRPLLDAKNWDGAIALLSDLSAKVPAESYDKALVDGIIGKLYLQKGDFARAVGPLENEIRLADAHKNYMEKSALQDDVYYLAQLYYQEATTSKDHAVMRQDSSKAIAYLDRWLANCTKPPFDTTRADALMMYSQVLYFSATLDQKHVDRKVLDQALAKTKEALTTTVKPKENLYIILLAIYQTEENYDKLAEVLELLVKQFPSKKDYWGQLASVYSALAASTKDEKKIQEYNIRTIVTIENAQALGFMKTPKDNYSLFGLYFNAGQFTHATELLLAGLRDGSIESELKNWELLASSYQQADRPNQAIEALKEGAKHFPHSGELQFQIATIYYSLNKPEESFKYLQMAFAKGNLEKPAAAYGFMAYVAWELNKYSDALAAVEKALTYPESAKDAQLPKLKASIEEALRERAAPKTAAKQA